MPSISSDQHRSNEHRQIEGKHFVRITHHDYFQNIDPNNQGYLERMGHIALLQGGAASFMIMCIPKDENTIPRKIKSFDSTVVFAGGDLIELDGESWLEMKERVKVSNTNAIF